MAQHSRNRSTTLKADHLLRSYKALPLQAQNRFLAALDDVRESQTDYVVIARSRLEALEKIAAISTEGLIRSGLNRVQQVGELRKKLKRRSADRDRLERGQIILAARRTGISWKSMPSHILATYPDWFPEFRDRRPNRQERSRLQERLRKMARDARSPGDRSI
jgi:hypothetical protein